MKLPITLEPTLPNAKINDIKLQGIDTKHSPLIRMFDNDGYELLPDAYANLHRGEQALPDILRLLDIQSDLQINYDSRNYQILYHSFASSCPHG